MNRRAFLNSTAAALGLLRERMAAATDGNRNIRWACSMFLWTSSQWRNDGSAKFTDMLDVIKDSGLDGFRLTGWPKSLETYGMPAATLERELSKRGLSIATMTFTAPGHLLEQQPRLRKSAKKACEFLKSFGAKDLVVFSGARSKRVLIPEHLKTACAFYNEIGDICAQFGMRAGLHNHIDNLVESQDEVETVLKLTDPKRFGWAPDTIHLYLAGAHIVELFQKYGHRLMFMDYVDAKYKFADEDLKLPNGQVEKAGTADATFMLCNRDLGDGEVDFVSTHKILKKNNYRGWICIDHHYTPVSPRHSFERCREYIRTKLEPIYS